MKKLAIALLLCLGVATLVFAGISIKKEKSQVSVPTEVSTVADTETTEIVQPAPSESVNSINAVAGERLVIASRGKGTYAPNGGSKQEILGAHINPVNGISSREFSFTIKQPEQLRYIEESDQFLFSYGGNLICPTTGGDGACMMQCPTTGPCIPISFSVFDVASNTETKVYDHIVDSSVMQNSGFIDTTTINIPGYGKAFLLKDDRNAVALDYSPQDSPDNNWSLKLLTVGEGGGSPSIEVRNNNSMLKQYAIKQFSNTQIIWKKDSSGFFYTKRAPGQEDITLYKKGELHFFNVLTGKDIMLLAGPTRIESISPTGQFLLVSIAAAKPMARLTLYDISKNKEVPIVGEPRLIPNGADNISVLKWLK